MSFQIFVSYAHDDNLMPPGDKASKGFVTFLHEQLLYELAPYQPRPVVFMDKEVRKNDQFEPKLTANVAAADHLIVIGSRNWITSPWCNKELGLFTEKWRAVDDEVKVRERITLVRLNDVPRDSYPDSLQGQVGYFFFTRDSDQKPLFHRGKMTDEEAYVAVVAELARDLAMKTRAASNGRPPGTASQAPAVTSLLPRRPDPPPPGGRIVYVAKPASDMDEAYKRLVSELQRRELTIVPDPAEKIPSDATSSRFVADAVAKAEFSIHLLGEKDGYQPEDTPLPIVPLQLSAAAGRVMRQTPSQMDRRNAFCRLIWAPKIMESAAAGQETRPRDPIAVLKKFDATLEGDQIDSDSPTRFLESVMAHLERTRPQPVGPDLTPIQANTRVYITHKREDFAFAIDLAKLLQRINVECLLPAFDGEAAQLKELHQRNLKDCDSVVVCWGAAPEVWVKASSRELRDWQILGRTSRFACRGLIAGPQPSEFKSALLEVPPRNELDVLLDLTAESKPTMAGIAQLVDQSGPAK